MLTTMTEFYHVCFAVPDLHRAMHDFTYAAEIKWGPIRSDALGEWNYRIVFSRTAPHIELIEGPPGSPWDTTTGPRFDHLGWWTQSLHDTSRRLAEGGLPSDFDGCPYGRPFAYHRVNSIGTRFEIVDASAQASFLRTWNPHGNPMPALNDKRGTNQ
jgi:glyoxalase/bleomycin resistance protein/dioxygenase superfamily protein